jgi:ABC-type nickel/cobalt efflux system permease component RcnA
MTADPHLDSLRYALVLSSLATIAIIIYLVVLANTLVKIWNAEFQDTQEKITWFLFVLILSPIGMPLYLYRSWKQRTEQSAGAEKGQASQERRHEEQHPQEQRPQEQRSQEPRPREVRVQQPSGLSIAERDRELARLLEMKKNGILSTEEFNRAKQRLSA